MRADLMNLLRDELGLSGQKSRFPKKQTCLAIYSYAMNAQAPLGEVLLRRFPWCESWEAELRRLFGAYVAAKQRQSLLDYDDLLLYWAQMMGAPELAQLVAERFDHVLVDEYQDTNALQASILLGLKPDGRGASPSSATTPRRSTASAPRRCATSWTSPACSARRRRSSPWSRTTARPSRSWPRAMP